MARNVSVKVRAMSHTTQIPHTLLAVINLRYIIVLITLWRLLLMVFGWGHVTL